MLKSMYSGVTGMRSQQTKMDVVSNNIANVSTTGFKSGRVRFQDLISQIDSPAQGPTNNSGGTNPHQVGMGVQVSGTDTVMTGGSLQTTGRSLDFGIQNGDNSFFIVQAGDEGEIHYTRDGGFFKDENGDIVTASGLHVQGKTFDNPKKIDDDKTDSSLKDRLDELDNLADDEVGKIQIPENVTDEDIKLESFSIDDAGTITGTYGEDTYVIGQVSLANFKNPDGLEKAGGNLYSETLNSGEAEIGAPKAAGYGEIRTGFLEMSNVDLANEFTEMIVTNRAYQANSRSITTSDEMLQELINLKR